MKIVISPAKSLDYERLLPTDTHTQPNFLEETKIINSILVKKKPAELSKLMSISTALADLNWERNQQFSIPFTKENARPAAYTFNGGVYQGLDMYSLPVEKLDTLQNTLRILSGLYGILKPLDLIQPYRLEMGTKLPVKNSKNLYEFWQNKITQNLNASLNDGEVFVNLASAEYFGAVAGNRLKVPVITPIFKDWKNGSLKIISFYAKKARGAMVRYVVDNNAETLEDIRGFDLDGYKFSQEHTNKDYQPTFIR